MTTLGPGSVSVVLPCLNEAGSVGLCVTEALDALRAAGIPGEVVVVDNGSTDDSRSVAEASGGRVVDERRAGYGSALKTGIKAARGEVIVMADADWTYPLDRISQLVGPIFEDKADLAIGSRFGNLKGDSMPWLHRYVGTPTLTLLVRGAGGNPAVSDSQSGYRAFKRATILKLGLQADGMEFASEMLIKAGHHGLRLVDVPTGYRERIGESKLDTFADGFRHLRLIVLNAPEMLLVAPGAVLAALGVVFTVVTFNPGAFEVGSLRWQPVFFSTICLVLGVQGILVGLMLAHRSTSGAANGRWRFLRRTGFLRALIGAGVAIGLAGFFIDLVLLVRTFTGTGLGPGSALAGLAQSLLLVGGSLATSGLQLAWMGWDERRHESDPDQAPEP